MLSQRTFIGGLFWCNRYVYVLIMHNQHTGVPWLRYTEETGVKVHGDKPH